MLSPRLGILSVFLFGVCSGVLPSLCGRLALLMPWLQRSGTFLNWVLLLCLLAGNTEQFRRVRK